MSLDVGASCLHGVSGPVAEIWVFKPDLVWCHHVSIDFVSYLPVFTAYNNLECARENPRRIYQTLVPGLSYRWTYQFSSSLKSSIFQLAV